MTGSSTPHETTGGTPAPRRVVLAQEPTFAGFSGITMQALVGNRLMLNRVVIPPGGVVPEHSHVNEQGGYVLEGVLNLTLGGETWHLVPGDAYVIPADFPHGATAGPEGCVVLDVFSPPREDYLARLRDEG